MNYKGTIIKESLENTDILKDINIINTKVESVTGKHKTPWLKIWTLYTAEVDETQAARVAEKISESLNAKHGGSWYADFKNEANHFIIFRNKIFFINRRNKKQYNEAKRYGLSLGIPEYQVDFHPDLEEWKR